jgi:hypothetical protein
MNEAIKQICPKCKGKGYHAKINWGLAALTAGFTAIIDLAFADWNTCRVCHGKAVL